MSTENPYASPTTQLPGAPPPVDWQPLLFSFSGRVGRRTFWGVRIAAIFVYLASVILVLLAFGKALITYLVTYGGLILLLWVLLAISIKRWHDRDKPGWWALMGCFPIVGWVWALVEAGCLRGTVGPNHYGPDPT